MNTTIQVEQGISCHRRERHDLMEEMVDGKYLKRWILSQALRFASYPMGVYAMDPYEIPTDTRLVASP